MTRRAAVLVAAIAAVLGGNRVYAAPIVYSQPPVENNDLFTGFFASSSPFGAGSRTYDNFELSDETLITDLHWYGGYLIEQGSATGFTITFWDDVLGAPGAALLTQTIPGNAGEVQVGTIGGFLPVYFYSLDLTQPFLASASTPYWVSIVGSCTSQTNSCAWGWLTGTGGDGIYVQDQGAIRSTNPGDLAFDLTGVQPTVPEPTGLVLLGTGAVGWLVGRRRKRSS